MQKCEDRELTDDSCQTPFWIESQRSSPQSPCLTDLPYTDPTARLWKRLLVSREPSLDKNVQ